MSNLYCRNLIVDYSYKIVYLREKIKEAYNLVFNDDFGLGLTDYKLVAEILEKLDKPELSPLIKDLRGEPSYVKCLNMLIASEKHIDQELFMVLWEIFIKKNSFSEVNCLIITMINYFDLAFNRDDVMPKTMKEFVYANNIMDPELNIRFFKNLPLLSSTFDEIKWKKICKPISKNRELLELLWLSLNTNSVGKVKQLFLIFNFYLECIKANSKHYKNVLQAIKIQLLRIIIEPFSSEEVGIKDKEEYDNLLATLVALISHGDVEAVKEVFQKIPLNKRKKIKQYLSNLKPYGLIEPELPQQLNVQS